MKYLEHVGTFILMRHPHPRAQKGETASTRTRDENESI